MAYKIKKEKKNLTDMQDYAFKVKKEDIVIVDGKEYTLEDMKNWFIQIRGFPSILYFGKGKSQISGEGQSGGRYVTENVHKVENAFVEKLGEEEYKRKMDKLMKDTKGINQGLKIDE